ncbi:hypothetical protein KSP39_PZI010912 [Platanthera zijinensis]|uniref:Gag-pol polyprotein n=1 Tax=Platanthera zijinensis TaxID=2320716 RepID=A0AAP0BH89_9ASPA
MAGTGGSPTESSTTSTPPTTVPSSGFSRSGHDHNTPQITTIRLDGTNYLPWSRAVTLALKSRRLFGYVMGTTPTPRSDSPDWVQWESENSLVMSWLTNSMIESIARNYLFLDTAAGKWRRAETTYSCRGNVAQIFQLRRKIFLLRQRDRPPSAYYLEFTQLYQEYDHFDSITLASPEDEILVRAREDRNRVFEFLHGLHRDFDQISVQILGRSPLPSLPEVFSLVLQEFDQRQTWTPEPPPDGSALAAHAGLRTARDSRPRSTDKDHLLRDYCGKNRHTRETCFRLHGFPTPRGGSSSRGGRGPGRTSGRSTQPRSTHLSDVFDEPQLPPTPSATTLTLTPDEVLAFRRLIQGPEPHASSSSYAHQGPSDAHAAATRPSTHWIIDSRATDHMTGSSSGFVSYLPLSGRDKVSIADGSLSPIAGKGSIPCSSLTLSSVIHVQNFTRNLLSNSHITNSMNCSVTFFPSSCIFQDLKTGTVIGTGSLVDGLYVFDSSTTVSPPRALHVDQKATLESWHCRLGHPSTNSMKRLFPTFSSALVDNFRCDTCNRGGGSPHNLSPLPYSDTPLLIPPVYHPSQSTSPTPCAPPVKDPVPKPVHVYSRRPKGSNTRPAIWISDRPPDPSSGSIIPTEGTSTQHPLSKFVSYLSLTASHGAFVSSLSTVSIPTSWKAALSDDRWRLAMLEEMSALEKNGTWDLVQLPPGKKAVGCKWVFTVKQNPSGIIEQYKARLVARGFTQTEGIDYQETFAPVAKMNSIRILMSCAACKDWQLCQLYVKNAYLHGDLEEEIYMALPPGLTPSGSKGKVCRLRRPLYGLKQSARTWFGRFHKAMHRFGYRQSNADHTLFFRINKGKLTVLIVYVDDIIITGDDKEEIEALKEKLAKEFEVKDLGNLKYFLGIEVARSKHGIFLSQRKYVLDLLEATGMRGCRPADTPIEANHKLGREDGDVIDDIPSYQRLVGKLIYLSHTRPDISYVVGVLSCFMHSPKARHIDVAHRVLRYLKSSPGKGIMFSPNKELSIEVYTDADWAGSPTDRRSTTGYCSMVGGNAVSWRSKKQHVVARSSARSSSERSHMAFVKDYGSPQS